MIYILGGDGFVGSSYARYCENFGLDFRVINRINYQQFVGTDCDLFINANGNSKKPLAYQNPGLDFDLSVSTVKKSLLDFSYDRYLFLSSGDVYPNIDNSNLTKEDQIIQVNKQSQYGFHKYMSELMVRNLSPSWLIIRQGGFVGAGLRKNPIFDIMNSRKIWVDPESELQFISTDRSCEIVMGLLSQNIKNEVFNLSGLGTVSIKEVANYLGKKLYVQVGAQIVRSEMTLEKIQRYTELPYTKDSVLDFLNSNYIP